MKKVIFLVGFAMALLTSVNAQNCPRYIGGDSTKTTPAYSIYREFFKKNLYADALPQWQNMYANAPAFRKQTFYDGADMYISFIKNAKEREQANLFADTLFQIYEKYLQCFGEDAYISGRYGTDLLLYGKNKDANIPKARMLLERNIQLSGDKTFYRYLQTYFKLLANQVGSDGITAEFVKQKYTELSGIIDRNLEKATGQQLDQFKEVRSSIDDLYSKAFVDKTDPADCAKLMEIYKKKYDANPNDLETIKLVYNRTKGCADSIFNVELLKKLNAMEPGYSYAFRLGSIYMKNNQMDEAYVLYENASAKEPDSSKRADLFFVMANIKADKNDYPAAREFAKQALVYNPLMGKAYYFIGSLYVGSGKLCGPGTGFQSQIVLWPAFDYFKKAIEVGTDEIKEEAQKMITSYTQYLPTKADVAAKKLAIGAPYTVKCWINETTTVQVRAGGGTPAPKK